MKLENSRIIKTSFLASEMKTYLAFEAVSSEVLIWILKELIVHKES